MLGTEHHLNNLKKEMDCRKLEKKYEHILGSIVYCHSQREFMNEIFDTNLEKINTGHYKVDQKKESLLDTLTNLIHDFPLNNNGEIAQKVKRITCCYDLTIDTNLYDDDINEIDYEKNIYLKKYKQCSPIKRNSFKVKKVFSENEETWL
jgi:hypothetical protein